MKGMLWQNTLAVGLIIIVYFLVLLVIQYIFSIFSATPILDQWSTAEPDYVQTFLAFFMYFVIPLVIAVTFIVQTKPRPEVVGGFG